MSSSAITRFECEYFTRDKAKACISHSLSKIRGIDDVYKVLSINEARVYVYLLDRTVCAINQGKALVANAKVYLRRKQQYIADDLKLSVRTIVRIFKKLRQCGLVETIQPGLHEPNLTFVKFPKSLEHYKMGKHEKRKPEKVQSRQEPKAGIEPSVKQQAPVGQKVIKQEQQEIPKKQHSKEELTLINNALESKGLPRQNAKTLQNIANNCHNANGNLDLAKLFKAIDYYKHLPEPKGIGLLINSLQIGYYNSSPPSSSSQDKLNMWREVQDPNNDWSMEELERLQRLAFANQIRKGNELLKQQAEEQSNT